MRLLARPAAASGRLLGPWGCVGAASRSGGAALARPRVVLRSARASTGRLATAAPRVLGLRVGAGGGRKNLRWRVPSVDLPPSEGSPGGGSTAKGVRRGNDASFSWTVPREGRSAAHPTPKCTQDSALARARSNASALVTGSRSKRRSLGPPAHKRRILRPTRPTAREPRPARPPSARSRPFGDHPQRQPTQRSSKQRPPAAAHHQAQTPCGSAAPSPDLPRQRTSRVTPTAAPQVRARRAGTSPSRRRPGWRRG
ncbi:hypothetical protein QE370_003418 [Aeromicrobium sp. SORGH_AS981]|nr:hypothetical protein [Aeromicrobium sp. SORGH_AS_0981]